MRASSSRHYILRELAYVLLLFMIAVTGVQGQRPDIPSLRIGLRVGQTSVKLQGTIPVNLTSGETPVVNVPADAVTTFTISNGEIVATDDTGTTLLSASQPIQIKPAGAQTTPDDENPPLIRLLGPTRHYDKREDRPYRGSFELLPYPDGITVVNIVDIEQYLLGVVSSEMSPGYPLEALKAQAVAARTYAEKNVGHYADRGFDMDDTPRCQVYGGYFSEDPRTTKAVTETAHQVLTYQGELIDALYSSTCGGVTEDAKDTIGKDVPYLKSVPDYTDMKLMTAMPKTEEAWANYFKTAQPFECLQPKYAKTEAFRWVRLLTRKEIEAGLPEANRVGTLMNIFPLKRGKSGRITALRLEGSQRSVVVETELGIRNALGGSQNMRSSAFTIDTYRDDNGVPVVFALWGAGWGHGLGMCQVGAVGLADQGWTYEKILHHYYANVDIEQR